MKELTIEQATQANGTAALADAPAPATNEQPLTPDQRLAAFQQELDALLKKYGVQLVPYIITFNNGTQIADAKFVPVQK